MFGYILANPALLTEEQKKRYRAAYCGLCEALRKSYGASGRLSLQYDLTFLALTLSSVYNAPSEIKSKKCAIRPFSAHNYIINEVYDYAAAMNIALAYYKCVDDVRDDRSVGGFFGEHMYKKEYAAIAENYPRQCDVMKTALSELSALEDKCELNPDITARCFGKIMGEIFAYRQDGLSDKLRDFGSALGSFVYILDACVDLKADLRRKRYNPIVALPTSRHREILEMLMADCTEKLAALPVTEDKDIIENILYSGVWLRYEAKFKGEGKV